jgi:hypothetical protein
VIAFARSSNAGYVIMNIELINALIAMDMGKCRLVAARASMLFKEPQGRNNNNGKLKLIKKL